MQTLFRNKGRSGASMPATPLDALLAGVQSLVNSQGHGSGLVSKNVAKAAIAMEGVTETQLVELDQSVSGLESALESILATNTISSAQRRAATAAAVLGSDIGGFLRAPIKHDVIANESTSVVVPSGADFMGGRMREALEAYDERENKNAVVYSVAYNMQAARQDEFGEAFFPTVVVTPDQVGFAVSIRLVQVYNEVRRQITGKFDNFNKRNIIQAVIDPTILRNDQTKIVPVYRAEAAAVFVANADVAPRNVSLEGTVISTAPLKMGATLSLLGVSQTDALLETGLQDSTDSIDTAVTLENLYMKVGNQVIPFGTLRLPTAVFNYAVQGNYRAMNLSFTTESLLVDVNTKDVTGASVDELTPIGTNKVRLSVKVSGQINLETAETTLFASQVTVVRVSDTTGLELDIASGAGKAAADVFAAAAMIGYDLDARRTNLNRRQRGQLLDVTFYNQIYAVPLRSPITVPRPLTNGDQNDSSDLAALITATHIRTSNAAVEELLKTADFLKAYVNSADSLGETPEILGVARFLVKPFYEEANLNVATSVDSIKSFERARDIQAVLVNKLRDIAYRMYRDSGYKAAADALAGGQGQVPTVTIGTDPVLARYLMVEGDLRTLGGEFNVNVVSTLNQNMSGKIVMSFSGGGSDGVPNPMTFGNMAWKPEMTLVLPLHRNGANSKELTVQPSFLHIVNLPIMGVITVEGIEDVIASKATFNMHTV